MHPNVRDLTGKTFGRLTVASITAIRKKGNVVWQCLCMCGNACLVMGCNLSSGNTQSCGCWHSVTSTVNGRKDSRKLFSSGAKARHRKAGGTVRAKALLKRLGLK